MATVRGYPYGCPHPPTIYIVIYIYIHTDIRADVGVALSVLRTVRPGQAFLWRRTHSRLWSGHAAAFSIISDTLTAVGSGSVIGRKLSVTYYANQQISLIFDHRMNRNKYERYSWKLRCGQGQWSRTGRDANRQPVFASLGGEIPGLGIFLSLAYHHRICRGLVWRGRMLLETTQWTLWEVTHTKIIGEGEHFLENIRVKKLSLSCLPLLYQVSNLLISLHVWVIRRNFKTIAGFDARWVIISWATETKLEDFWWQGACARRDRPHGEHSCRVCGLPL